MANHRDQARFERAGWRLPVLITSWIAQIALLLGLMGTFAYRLSRTIGDWEAKEKAGSLPTVELVWECTNVGLSLIALVINIVEIAKTVSESLTPFLMLCTHIMKLTCAFGTLALDIVVYIQRSDQNYSIIGLAVDCALLAVTLITFAYSLVIFRRLRSFEDYHLTHNVKHYGFGGDDVELGNKVQISSTRVRSISLTTSNADTSYPSQTTNQGRRVSASSIGSEPYSHRRDTLYEGYLERHAPSLLQGQVDQTVGAEFGWGSKRPSSGALERSSSFVGTGTVHAATAAKSAVPSVDVVRRFSEHGLVTVHEDGDEAEHDGYWTGRSSRDDGGAHTGRPRAHSNEDDTSALLAPRGSDDGVETTKYTDTPDVGRSST